MNNLILVFCAIVCCVGSPLYAEDGTVMTRGFLAKAEHIVKEGKSDSESMLQALQAMATDLLLGKEFTKEEANRWNAMAEPQIFQVKGDTGTHWVALNAGRELEVDGHLFTVGFRVYTHKLRGTIIRIDSAMTASIAQIHENVEIDKITEHKHLHPIWKGALRLRKIRNLRKEFRGPGSIGVSFGEMGSISAAAADYCFQIDIKIDGVAPSGAENGAKISLRAYSGLVKQRGTVYAPGGRKTIVSLPKDLNCCEPEYRKTDPLCRFFEVRHEQRW